jgi:outer membrane receptor for ferrienterochelin and colicin
VTKKILSLVSLNLLGGLLFGQNFTINGYIRDQVTGENLIGATILDPATMQGTITNTFGFYSLTLPTGTYQLRCSYVGYQSWEQEVTLTQNQNLNISLAPGTTLEEVIITAEENIELSPQMSSIDVPIEQIKALPVLMGEADLLKSLQLLPGIQGGTEGSSGIYVRGGGPDQNLILLDGVPVYNVSHLFGFFSVFNPDAINRVNVVKGGFPARYGGRLSSVIDISMKEGNNQKFSGEGSIGLISSKLTLEGPIGKDKKTSFLVSGRRTYIDLLTRPIIRAQSDGQASGGYYFYDVNAKMNRIISDKDRVYLSFYNGLDKGFGKDAYQYQSDGVKYTDKNKFGLNWGNTITALRWNHTFGPRLFANFTGTYSKYKFRIFSEYETITKDGNQTEREAESIEYFSGIDDLGFKVDFDFLPSPQHNIKAGINMIHHQFNPGILGYETNLEGESDTTLGANKTLAAEFATYVEDDFKISDKLRANGGLHYSSFLVNQKYYHSLQPRLSMRYLLGNDLSLKASFATMTQYIHLLTNGGLGLPTDLWVPATDRISPQRSWQVALGAAKTFSGFEGSIEVYYKEMNNLIEYKEGASYFNLGSDWQDKVTVGSGESYGAEFLIQKKTGKLSGWVGYTLSWTNRTFEALNFGKQYPYKYDRRHDVSIVAVYNVSKTFAISSTWVYGTGAAITLPESEYEQESTNDAHFSRSIQKYSSRNGYRMRDYHRMDLGLTWTKPKKNGERSWSLGAYNLYNRKNPFFLQQGYDNRGNKKFIQYSLFPLIPYVRYSFKF